MEQVFDFESAPEPKAGHDVELAGVGYGRPPASTRFRKGQSGNPRGRPRGSKSGALPYEAVLGRLVTIRDGAAERRVSAEEAFLLHIAKSGLSGDGGAARAAMAAIEAARAQRRGNCGFDALTITYKFVAPGSVSHALEPLRMARMMNRYAPGARILLEPWLVEAALARLGSRRLTADEQRTVVQATRTPHKVRWPKWWTVRE